MRVRERLRVEVVSIKYAEGEGVHNDAEGEERCVGEMILVAEVDLRESGGIGLTPLSVISRLLTMLRRSMLRYPPSSSPPSSFVSSAFCNWRRTSTTDISESFAF